MVSLKNVKSLLMDLLRRFPGCSPWLLEDFREKDSDLVGMQRGLEKKRFLVFCWEDLRFLGLSLIGEL